MSNIPEYLTLSDIKELIRQCTYVQRDSNLHINHDDLHRGLNRKVYNKVNIEATKFDKHDKNMIEKFSQYENGVLVERSTTRPLAEITQTSRTSHGHTYDEYTLTDANGVVRRFERLSAATEAQRAIRSPTIIERLRERDRNRTNARLRESDIDDMHNSWDMI